MKQFEHTSVAYWIVSQSSSAAVRDFFQGGEGMNLLFNGFESSNEENMVRQQEEEVR